MRGRKAHSKKNESYREEALMIAKQLHHPIKVQEAIKNAENSDQIATIMFVAMKDMDGNCHG